MMIMKSKIRKKVFLTLSLLSSLSQHIYAQSEMKLGLEEAKKYAVAHNYGIIALRHEMEQLQKKHAKNGAAFLPKIGAAAGGETQITSSGSEAGTVAYLYGSYNLFNRYQDTNSREISKFELDQATIKLNAAEFAVKLDVEEVFHTYLYKKNLIELKDDEIELNLKHQDFVRRTKQKGLASETDIMEFQLADSSLRSDLVALKQELEDARSNLKRLLGDEIGGNITPIGTLQHQHVKGSLMDVLNKVQAHAAPVKGKALDVSIARVEQKTSENKWLPQIDFEVKSGFLPQDRGMSADRSIQTSFALVAKMDLYTGGEIHWEKQEKAENTLKREAELKDEINLTIRKIEMGYRNLKVIENRADLEKDNISFAERYYNSVLSEYTRGFKNSPDLASATEKLSTAKARTLNLEYEFIKQRLDIERSLGAPLEIEVVSIKDQKP